MKNTTAHVEVLAVARELLIAASGSPITVSTVTGDSVILRLPTVEEFREANRRARAHFAELGVVTPEPPSDAEIADIVKPLNIWGDA